MNELLAKAPASVAGTSPGSAVAQPASPGVPEKPAGANSPGLAQPSPLPPVGIGKPGYQFKNPGNTSAGQDERREHERIRKADKRASHQAAQPPPLVPLATMDALQAPGGELGPVPPAASGPVVAEPFVPWVGGDVSDFTDELVELAEVRRVADFVKLAKDADMPGKFIAEVEKRSQYPTRSKSALKATLSECAAKWLNKTGVSSKNKEEVKLLFCMVTIKLQGVRLKKDLIVIIAADRAKREAEVKENA